MNIGKEVSFDSQGHALDMRSSSKAENVDTEKRKAKNMDNHYSQGRERNIKDSQENVLLMDYSQGEEKIKDDSQGKDMVEVVGRDEVLVKDNCQGEDVVKENSRGKDYQGEDCVNINSQDIDSGMDDSQEKVLVKENIRGEDIGKDNSQEKNLGDITSQSEVLFKDNSQTEEILKENSRGKDYQREVLVKINSQDRDSGMDDSQEKVLVKDQGQIQDYIKDISQEEEQIKDDSLGDDLGKDDNPGDEMKLPVYRIHSVTSECESGYGETPSECDIREVEDEEEEGLVASLDHEAFTDEGRESVETAEVDDLDEDSVASTEMLTDSIRSMSTGCGRPGSGFSTPTINNTNKYSSSSPSSVPNSSYTSGRKRVDPSNTSSPRLASPGARPPWTSSPGNMRPPGSSSPRNLRPPGSSATGKPPPGRTFAFSKPSNDPKTPSVVASKKQPLSAGWAKKSAVNQTLSSKDTRSLDPEAHAERRRPMSGHENNTLTRKKSCPTRAAGGGGGKPALRSANTLNADKTVKKSVSSSFGDSNARVSPSSPARTPRARVSSRALSPGRNTLSPRSTPSSPARRSANSATTAVTDSASRRSRSGSSMTKSASIPVLNLVAREPTTPRQRTREPYICSRKDCGRQRDYARNIISGKAALSSSRGRPVQLWQIQQTLGRGDFIEGILNVDFSNGSDSFICAPIKLGRTDGHLDVASSPN